jgi:hypothetical protein
MSENPTPGDYEVGYGKPPKHSQFKPGQSGYPKGRPKGSKNLKTDLREELAERVQIKEGDRTKTITKQRLLIKSILARGIKDSDAAAARLLDLCIKAFGIGDETGNGDRALTAEEREILKSFEARLIRKDPAARDPDAGTGGEARP